MGATEGCTAGTLLLKLIETGSFKMYCILLKRCKLHQWAEIYISLIMDEEHQETSGEVSTFYKDRDRTSKVIGNICILDEIWRYM